MSKQVLYNSFLELPGVIFKYLTGPVVKDFMDKIKLEAALNQEQLDLLSGLQTGLLQRTISVSDVSKFLTESRVFTESEVVYLTQEFLGYFCGPIRWYFPDLYKASSELQVSLPVSNAFSIEEPHTTREQVMSLIIPIVDDIPSGKQMLIDYLNSLFEIENIDFNEIYKKINNPVSDGGFGVHEKRVKDIVKILRNHLGVFVFDDVDSVKTAVFKKTNSSVEIPKEFLDETEVAEIVEKAPAAAAVLSAPLTAEQKHLVEAVLAIEPLDDRSNDIQVRWKTIVEARIGGARDAAKTKSLLQAAAENGGLGLSADETNRLANLLEETAARFEKHREDFSVMEKIASVQKNTAAIVAGPEAVSDKSQKQLNDRFVSMFGKDAVSQMRAETHREIESFSQAHPNEAEHAATLAPISEPKYVPKVPEKLKQLIDAENPVFPIKPKVVAPAALQQKKSSDIRPGARLVGPIDELKILTLVDFRRLAPDASVRIQKIRSKIDVIGRDGAHEKIRAVQAFEQSEPVRLYRELLRGSLMQQVDIEEMSERYRSEGKPSLEPDEISQIGAFLAQIRYANI